MLAARCLTAWRAPLPPQRPCLRYKTALGLSCGAMAGGFVMSAARAPMVKSAAASSSGQGSPFDVGHPARRATDALLLINVACFALQILSKDVVTIWGLKVNELIVRGQYWRLVTPAFLHGSLVHLVVNSASLNNLGPAVEGTTGHARFLAIYAVAAVAGTAASFFLSSSPSLGASGAIFGVGGALGMYFARNKALFGRRSDAVLRQLWQTLAINLVYGLTSPRIDNWGHLGGLVGGAVAAYLLGPRYEVGSLPGRKGTFLLDRPPLPLFASEPRLVGR